MPLDTVAATARLAAIEALANAVTHEDLVALVHAAFRSKQKAANNNSVRTALAGGGGVLGDEEYALLAAATLAVILRKDRDSAARAATMICAASLNGLRQVKQPMDMVALASSSLKAQALRTRQRPDLVTDHDLTFNVDPTKAVESEDENEALTLLAAACTEVIESLSRRQLDFEKQARQYIRIQDEELNMLWWLQGGYSHTYQSSFEAIPREQRPFVFAHELAGATCALPGPAAMVSLLTKAGVDEQDPVEIVPAIQALPHAWLESAFPGDDNSKVSPVITPIHEAFKRRLEVHGEDTWIQSWASVCGIAPAAKLPPLRLAELCYFEQLVITK